MSDSRQFPLNTILTLNVQVDYSNFCLTVTKLYFHPVDCEVVESGEILVGGYANLHCTTWSQTPQLKKKKIYKVGVTPSLSTIFYRHEGSPMPGYMRRTKPLELFFFLRHRVLGFTQKALGLSPAVFPWPAAHPLRGGEQPKVNLLRSLKPSG